MMGRRRLSASYVEQQTRREQSLVTPITFDVALGATDTTIYTGSADFSLLLRKLIVVNDTAGAINFTFKVDGNVVVPATSISASTAFEEEGLAGFLVDPSKDLAATGNGMRAVGWGVRVQGGSEWVL